MARQILVALKKQDRVDQLIPYLEKLAQPGTRVVFLVHCPVDGFNSLQDCLLTNEFGIDAHAISEVARKYAWEEEKRFARRKVSAAYEVLQKRGVEVTVEVCRGSLKRELRSYMLGGDVLMVIMPAGIAVRIKRFLYKTIRPFAWFTWPNASPVLTLQPGTFL